MIRHTSALSLGRGLRLRSRGKIGVAILLLSVSLGLPHASKALATTLPTGAVVVSGDVDVEAASSTLMCLLQRSPNAIMDWTSFDVPADARFIVDQPSTKSVLLNRVTGDTPSVLAGAVRATGSLWLVNPNGIDIVENASVRTAGFLASTLPIDDSHLRDFEADNGAQAYGSVLFDAKRGSVAKPLIDAADGDDQREEGARPIDAVVPTEAGSVRHRGSIVVRKGGQVMLIGASLKNTGRIIAEEGRVQLLGWRAKPSDHAVHSTGLIQSDTGSINITGLDGQVNLQGRVDASSRIASGGTVEVHAPMIAVAHAVIDVSGKDGGGSVALVAQSDDEPAATLSVGRDAILQASALSHGNGGAVSIVCNGETTFDGRATAKGADDSVLRGPRVAHSSGSGAAAAAAASGASDDSSGDSAESASPMFYRRGGSVHIVGSGKLDVGGDVDVSVPVGHGPGTVHFIGGNTAIMSRQRAMARRVSGAEQSITPCGGAICADTLSRALAHANVTVSAGMYRGDGNGNGDDDGEDVNLRGGDGQEGGGVLHVLTPIAWHADTALSLRAADYVQMDATLRATGEAASLVFSNDRTVFDKGRVCMSGKDATLSISGIPYTLLRDRDLLTLFSRRGNGYFALADGTDFHHELLMPIAEDRAVHFRRLDGMGNIISRVTMHHPEGGNIGLFDALSGGAMLANITLDDVHMTGRFNVGSVVGYLRDGSQLSRMRIRRAAIQAAPDGTFGAATGGIVGSASSHASIVHSEFHGRVAGHMSVGAIAGQMNSSAYCIDVNAVGEVSGMQSVGGLVGAMGPQTVLTRGNWWGQVAGTGVGNHAIAGLVGELRRARLSHAVASGEIRGERDVGGIVGTISGGTVVRNVAACHVVAQDNVGGIAGSVNDGASLEFNQSPGRVTAKRKGGTLIGNFTSGTLRENRAAPGVLLNGVVRAMPIGFVPHGHAAGSLDGQ